MANLLTQPLLQFFNNGVPLNGGEVFFYQSGTTTKTTIYQDNGITPAPNPVTLNSNGVPSNNGTPIPIYFPHGQTVKVVVAPSGAGDPPTSTLYIFDPVIGEQDVDYGIYFTSTSSSILTLNSGKTLAISGTIDLTSGAIKIATIQDTNGNTIVTLTPTASAVNAITITDAATGNDPSIAASGTDTNIGLDLKGKGTGPVKLGQATSTDVRLVADQPIADSSGNAYIAFTKTASAVNRLNITNAAASGTVAVAPSGTDVAIPLSIDTKGSSTLNLGQTNATAVNIGQNNTNTTIQVGQNILPTAKGAVAQHIRVGSTAGTLAFFSAMNFENVQVITATGANTFNVPANLQGGSGVIWVRLWGAGGGGGGANASGALAGGGGGGAYLEKLLTIPNGTTTLTITIGTGGTAGSISGGNGGTGGSTTLTGTSITTLTAGGGSGGAGQPGAGSGAGGGGGGIPTNGDLSLAGQPGLMSISNLTGAGGFSPNGGYGGAGVASNSGIGNGGAVPGGGASGGSGGTTAGAAGANGYCVIIY